MTFGRYFSLLLMLSGAGCGGETSAARAPASLACQAHDGRCVVCSWDDLLGVMSCGGQSGGVVLPSGTGRKLRSQHARLSGWSAGVWRRGLLLWAPGPYASRERLCDIGVVDFERGANVDRL